MKPNKEPRVDLEKADFRYQPDEALESFAVKYAQMRFLITVCLIAPRIWREIKRDYYGRYVTLVREQSEIKERQWDEEWDRDWAEAKEKVPDLEQRCAKATQRKEARMKERQEQADTNSAPTHSTVDRGQTSPPRRSSTLEEDAYDIYLEISKVSKGYSHLRPLNLDSPYSTGARLVELDGNDAEVERFREDLLEHMKKWGLGEYWCGEQLINVMRRNERATTPDARPTDLRGRSDQQSDWMNRFDSFIAQIDSELEKFGEGSRMDLWEEAQLVEAWRLEWGSQSRFSHEGGIKTNPPRGYPHWNANVESRAEYLAEIERAGTGLISKILPLKLLSWKRRELIKDWLKEAALSYCKTVVEDYRSIPGWKPVETKKELVRHLVWTAMYQVASKSYTNVAVRAEVAISTAKRAIDQVLDIINLQKSQAKKSATNTTNHHGNR